MLLKLFVTSSDKYVIPSIEFEVIKKKVVWFWSNNLDVRLLKNVVAYIVLNTVYFQCISSAVHLLTFISGYQIWK